MKPLPTIQPSDVVKDMDSIKKESNVPNTPTPRPVLQTRMQGANDVTKLKGRLNEYKNATTLAGKGAAMDAVVQLLVTKTSKSLLDATYEFFKENKDEPFLAPDQALACVHKMKPAYATKATLLYEIMTSIARNKASTATISIKVVDNIYNTTFANWLQFLLGKKGRR